MATRPKDICPHGLQAILCYVCMPERHTYLAMIEAPKKGYPNSGRFKTFVAPSSQGAERAKDKARAMHALQLYKLIWPMHNDDVEAVLKEEDDNG